MKARTDCYKCRKQVYKEAEQVEAPDADDYISITPEEMLLNKAYCDDRILEAIRNRPPEETEARKKYTEECIRKAKELTEKNGIIF